ncbi:hypothetical protein HK099_002030 [Clydaea vesicula]|uniref:Smr domain-containing protein n=1 Tax=Clydaea vesicula TaxID=447962 RepID=A0AAD5XWZ4_9FUNG|nr:hypothetical protein HK099_002030 [Clydaea vesicula]
MVKKKVKNSSKSKPVKENLTTNKEATLKPIKDNHNDTNPVTLNSEKNNSNENSDDMEFINNLFESKFTKEKISSVHSSCQFKIDDTINQLLTMENDDDSESLCSSGTDSAISVQNLEFSHLKIGESNSSNSQVLRIKEMFPDVPEYRIISLLNQNFFDISDTINHLLNLEDTLKNSSTYKENNDADFQLSYLMKIFEQSTPKELSSILKKNNFDLDKTINFLTSKNKFKNNCDGKCAENGFPCLKHQHKVDESVTFPEIQYTNSKNLETKFQNHLSSLSETSEPNTNKKYDHNYARSLAQKIGNDRAELFNNAACAYQKKGLTGFSSAYYYAQEGHKKTVLMNKWNRIASDMIIEENHKNLDNYTVDLHGLTVKESICFVRERVNLWYQNKNSRENLRPLRIITGVGNNSNGVPRLNYAIKKFLKREQWKFDSYDSYGYILVIGES